MNVGNGIKLNYQHTIYASYLGYITQAVVNNFAPLLFLTFQTTYQLSIKDITWITTVNFFVQLCVDLISAKFIDRIGYRTAIVAAHILAASGLMGLAFFPSVFPDAYTGLLTAVVLYAIGGGIIEVLISPIVEACPTERKEAAMSLLHSFYCWGHVFLVVISTIFFSVFGLGNWPVLACVWAMIPLFNSVYFCFVPIMRTVEEEKQMNFLSLMKQKVFWLLVVVMVCAGASELAMSQWASAFAESALGVSKTIGDLLGPCAFAVLMGSARAIYGKCSDRIPLKKFMIICAVICIGCYTLTMLAEIPILGLIGCAVCGFSVGIFWPGTFSVAAMKLPAGGTVMYALMALAGDIGCSSGPTVVGMAADSTGGNLKFGLGAAMIFPVIILFGLAMLKIETKVDKQPHQ